MIKLNTYTSKGSKTSKTSLPSDYKQEDNPALLAQAIYYYQHNFHPKTSKVKTRSQVIRSKSKLYRQKGTGRARHGSANAPIFVGGGVTHGPKGLKRSLSFPKKFIRKALNIALTQKSVDNTAFIISSLSSIKKTKDASSLLKKLDIHRSSTLLALSKDNMPKLKKFFRNIKNLKIVQFSDLNTYDVLYSKYLLIDKDALATPKTIK